ncbi:MAG: 16S rRNA (cytosine(1402)-N(4))-methyltransferase RsmH [Marinifilaceae bacterium]|jgi:16S rRNA (cytosine1402-N4)-methyltransferase|nr:16S rRNA (cytosine(1402)-N(4))-methyltransferase RsmH [Marinifilaceae bacterium]
MSEYHVPVLLQECIEGLNIKPDGVYVDLTFGGGGHSREILKHLGENGRLIGFDQDIDAKANAPEDDRFTFVRHNFKYIKNFVKYLKFNKVDGVLADLGVSSHEIDESTRGFSYRFDGLLDMRMNQSAEFTAAELLNTYPKEDLLYVFKAYGEIKNASKLVNIIDKHRQTGEFESIEDFKNIIASCIPKHKEYRYLAQVFQALRIEVNKEMDALRQMLESIPDVLKDDGRLVVITYHSLEDRLVKNFIKSGRFDGKLEQDFYGNTKSPMCAINRKIILPTEEEIAENNRARSAKLRIAGLSK